MKKVITAPLLIILVLPAIIFEARLAFAQAEQAARHAKVDALFANWDKSDSPGAAIAILQDGEIVYQQGYGMANLEYDIPISPATVFPIASVSKQFTAFAIAVLEDQGLLSLDDDIRTYVPEMHDFGKTITIRHLVHHTSGLRDNAELMLMAGFLNGDLVVKSRNEALIYNQQELNFEPGTEYLYCNTGYFLLAEIVARITGQPFSQWMAEQVFQPLGMKHTHVHDNHARLVKNRAYAYQEDGEGGYIKNALNSGEVGATGIYTTVEDLARWAANLETGRVGGNNARRRMQERIMLNGDTLSYAFGLVVEDYKGLRRVSHGGRASGYLGNLAYFPDQRFAVIILSNLFPADPILNPMALSMEVADIYLEKELRESPPPPVLEKPTTFTRPSMAALERVSGWYWNRASNYLRRIYVRDDTLRYYRRLANNESALAPLGNDRFLMLGTQSHVIVAFEPSGQKPERMLFIANGGSPVISEIEEGPSNPTEEELSAYEGTYFSEELNTAYSLRLQNGDLIVHHPSRGELTLTPIIVDHFKGGAPWWFGYDTHFTRNEKNEVTGFRLFNFHAKNLRFDKISEAADL